MNKVKTSMNIFKNYRNVYRAGYCDLQDIIPYGIKPMFYNAGLYGWNCDIYIDPDTDTVITTGYRNTRGKSIPYELIQKYSNKAKTIKSVYDYDTKNDALISNWHNFINELINTI